MLVHTLIYTHMYVCFKVRIHVRTYTLVKRRKKKQTFDGDNDDEEKESNEIQSIVSYIYIYTSLERVKHT